MPGFRDAEALKAFELDALRRRSEEDLPQGALDPAHYCAIHRSLFREVYRWAGRYRSIEFAIGEHHFCAPEDIAWRMEALFNRLDQPTFLRGAAKRDFIPAAAAFFAELREIHPFRKGNQRTQLSLLNLLGDRAGYPIHVERIAQINCPKQVAPGQQSAVSRTIRALM